METQIVNTNEVMIDIVDRNGTQTVSARELHKKLGINAQFTHWIERMIAYGFVENVDYVLVSQKRPTNNPRNPETTYNEYYISIYMAKEICMIQRSEIGCKLRQYFIDCENKLKQVAPKTYIEAVEPTTSKWYTVKEICEACGVTDRTFLNFKSEVGVKVLSQRTRQDSTHAKEYPESVLKQFQAWLLKNQANQGRSSSLVKQAVTNAVVTEIEEKWYTVKEICEGCNVNEKTFRRFKEESSLDSTVQSKTLSHNLKQYSESVLKQFQAWLKKNALNAGGQKTEGSLVKADNLGDMAIGFVMTKGTYEQQIDMIEFLRAKAEERHALEQQHEEDQKQIEQTKQDAMTVCGWAERRTVRAYAIVHNKQWDNALMGKIGKQLSAISRLKGFVIGQEEDRHWGYVNAYSVEAWALWEQQNPNV